MKARTNGVEEAVNGLLESGMKGELRKGDTIGLWTYNDRLNTDFPMEVWSEEKKDDILQEVREHLRHLRYEKHSHLDKALPAIMQVVENSERLTVILFLTAPIRSRERPSTRTSMICTSTMPANFAPRTRRSSRSWRRATGRFSITPSIIPARSMFLTRRIRCRRRKPTRRHPARGRQRSLRRRPYIVRSAAGTKAASAQNRNHLSGSNFAHKRKRAAADRQQCRGRGDARPLRPPGRRLQCSSSRRVPRPLRFRQTSQSNVAPPEPPAFAPPPGLPPSSPQPAPSAAAPASIAPAGPPTPSQLPVAPRRSRPRRRRGHDRPASGHVRHRVFIVDHRGGAGAVSGAPLAGGPSRALSRNRSTARGDVPLPPVFPSCLAQTDIADSAPGPPVASVRSRRAAKNPRPDQAQHEREPVSALPKVLAAIKAATDGRLRLYPNPTAEAVRGQLAKFHGCAPGAIHRGQRLR
jgi:hypothetical protein